MDLYSRKSVGGEVYERESAVYAAEVVRRAVLAEQGMDRPWVLPADNRSPSKGESLGETLDRRGLSTSYSRPWTRHDHPYAEAWWRTCKYRPDSPAQGLATLEEARLWRQPFGQGDHPEPGPRGIRFLARRPAVYEQAQGRPPERGAGPIGHGQPITEVWLNPSAEVINQCPASKPQTQ